MRALSKMAALYFYALFSTSLMEYADIGANNPQRFYNTPHINELAESGMRFTDGYAANPVCSATRYSLLTEKYALWEVQYGTICG